MKVLEEIKKIIRTKKNIFFLVGVVLIILFLYRLGFRITYNPKIITDWTAVSAVGQWCSVASSIFVVYLSAYLSQKFEKKTRDIANSNRATTELMSEIEKQIEEKVKIILDAEKGHEPIFNEQIRISEKKRILAYIEISIVTTTKKIAKYMGKSIEETYELLEQMEVEGKKIIHIGDDSKLPKEDLLWKSNEMI